MKVERSELESLIPHADGMCLLDAVVGWDEKTIHCQTNSHRLADNPLRSEGQLHSLHLTEYGAQAMAVHGGLLAQAEGKTAAPGFLAAVRGLQLQRNRVDDLDGPLDVRASQLMAAATGWTYQFTVHHADELLAEGRVMVMLQQEQPQ